MKALMAILPTKPKTPLIRHQETCLSVPGLRAEFLSDKETLEIDS